MPDELQNSVWEFKSLEKGVTVFLGPGIILKSGKSPRSLLRDPCKCDDQS